MPTGVKLQTRVLDVSSRGMRVARITLAVVWSALILVVFVGSVADSPAAAPHWVRQRLVMVIPEGWAFFTRNPRLPRTEIYLFDALHELYSRGDIAEYRGFAFAGIRRLSRVRGLEIERLLANIAPSQWRHCRGDLSSCSKALRLTHVQNDLVVRTLCGRIILRRSEPVPWAWSTLQPPVQMPAEWLMLSVQCAMPDD